MKRPVLLVISLVLGVGLARAQQRGAPFHPHRLIVKLRAKSALASDARAAARRAASPASSRVDAFHRRHRIGALVPVKVDAGGAALPGGIERIFVGELDTSVDVESAIARASADPEVEYAEPDFIGSGGGVFAGAGPRSGPGPARVAFAADDPQFGSQWGLQNTGQNVGGFAGKTGADINILPAWDRTTGSSETIVAILDSGVPRDAADFSGRLLPGYDYANNDSDPTDDNGHGSNVASIAAATGGNGIVMAGVNWRCRVLPVKILDSRNSGLYSWWIAGFTFAADQGADVINISAGGLGASASLADAVAYASSRGAIVLACTMNTNLETPYYPAAYESVIAIGGTNNRDARAVPFCFSETSGSNYGRHTDFVAPGERILGLSNSDPFSTSFWCGTSQATPLVAGIVSLMLAVNPDLTFQQVYDALKASAQDQIGPPSEDTPGWDKYFGWGRVDAEKALAAVGAPAEPVLTLHFPRLATSTNGGAGTDGSEYTGIAVANLGASSATLTFTAYDASGTTLAGSAITNPKGMTIAPGEQIAIVDTQLLGAGLTERRGPGWLKLASTAASITGFFLTFSANLSVLDGAGVSSSTSTAFVLPEIEQGGFTEIHAANPANTAATLVLELLQSDGTPRGPSAFRTVQPHGALDETIGSIFSGTISASDYVRVTSSSGVVGFEMLGRTGLYVAGLNAQDSGGGATTLYSPQYVVGGADWRTQLSIVNLEASAGTVTLELVGDNGVALAPARSLAIAARGKIRIIDQSFFVAPGSAPTQGYVRITSSGPRLAGSVVFGDPAQSRFASALPLVSTLPSGFTFSQLASNETYFTGIALLNPSISAATAVIDVYDAGGTRIDTTTRTLAAGERQSKLLTELFPALVGQNRSSGYIRVTADRGLASFALFGTRDLSVLAAIAAQVVP